ncbi:MAG TPA: hypothetical protein VHW43_00665 [Puia sp.]|nr:hypothetical protein [Puia sp.]
MRTAIKKTRTKSKKTAKEDPFKDLKMRDLSKDPYFMKKKEEAMEVLKRTGIILKP